jgi:hypothetical protein
VPRYLSSTGSAFGAWKEDQEEYEMLMVSLLGYPIKPYLISKIRNKTLFELGWHLGG